MRVPHFPSLFVGAAAALFGAIMTVTLVGDDDGVSVECAAAYGAFWRTWYETERFVDADISQDAYWWLTHDICDDDYGRVHDVGLSAVSYLTHRAIGMTESPFTDNPFARLEARS